MDSKIPNIRFKGFTDAWEQRRLGEVTIYQNGKGYEDSQSSSGKFELINLNSIPNFKLKLATRKKFTRRLVVQAFFRVIVNPIFDKSDFFRGRFLGSFW